VILARVLGVSVRTVDRWSDAEDIQASDLNARANWMQAELARIFSRAPPI
jgi:hypothetical protein